MIRRALILVAGMLILAACSNPFAPEQQPGGGDTHLPAPEATTPEVLMDNLHRAMRDRDKDLYETLLDRDFWFTETDVQGDLVFANGREEELEIMGGSRDGSRPGIFDIYRTFEFDFTLLPGGRSVELGAEYPEAYPGDPDGHPDEDWQTFRGSVRMLLKDEMGDGFSVNQIMTYKLRETQEGLWKIIRWVDDPLVQDSGTEKPVAGKRMTGLRTWSAVKQSVR